MQKILHAFKVGIEKLYFKTILLKKRLLNIFSSMLEICNVYFDIVTQDRNIHCKGSASTYAKTF